MKYGDVLEIFIVTYNRESYLKRTLDTLLKSPVKNCRITILNNNSTDGTAKICLKYSLKYPNITFIKHPFNCNGNTNIVKAFELSGTKKYVWVLGDDDVFSFKYLKQIDKAIEQDYDCIIVNKKWLPENYNLGQFLKQFSFCSGFMLKSSLITDDIIQTMYDMTQWLLPHFAIAGDIINNNRSVYVVDKEFVHHGIDNDKIGCYTRGIKDTHPYRRDMYWFCGFVNAIQIIKDKKLVHKAIDEFFEYNMLNGFIYELRLNRTYYNNNFKNVTDIYAGLNARQKILFIIAYIFINRLPSKYAIENSVEGFVGYLERKNINKIIAKLNKKYKNKKVIVYGAGIFAEAFFKFDYLHNIVAVADNMFEQGKETSYKGRIGINPRDINKYRHDVILINVYQYKYILRFLKQIGIKSKSEPIVKKSLLEKLFETRI